MRATTSQQDMSSVERKAGRPAPTVGRAGVVPYVTSWSEEEKQPAEIILRTSMGIGFGIAYADETPTDRDRDGILWTRRNLRHGHGRPQFGKIHSLRQRRAMRRLLCQVCAQPADRNDDGVLWLLPDYYQEAEGWPENYDLAEPPICLACVPDRDAAVPRPAQGIPGHPRPQCPGLRGPGAGLPAGTSDAGPAAGLPRPLRQPNHPLDRSRSTTAHTPGLHHRRSRPAQATREWVVTGPGVRDPEEPGRWLVEPWPADTSFGDVLEHFQRASLARLPSDGSLDRLLAFHQGLRAAPAATPIGDVTDQDRVGWCEDLLEFADLSVTLFLAHCGHDPQAAEDQHVQAVKHRTGTRSPEP